MSEPNPNSSSTPNPAPQSTGRPVQLFQPSNRPFNPRAVLNTLPEAFYSASGSDVRQTYNSLHTNTKNLQDAPLLTRKLRAAEEQKKMSRFPHTIIRFLFPDRYTLQGVFKPGDRVSDLESFVKECLKDDGHGVEFVLFVTPPKKILSDKKSTLWKEGFAPAAMVHVGIESGVKETCGLVRSDIWDKVQQVPMPKEVVGGMEGDGKRLDGGKGSSSSDKVKDAVQNGKKAAEKVIPKWLMKNLKKR